MGFLNATGFVLLDCRESHLKATEFGVHTTVSGDTFGKERKGVTTRIHCIWSSGKQAYFLVNSIAKRSISVSVVSLGFARREDKAHARTGESSWLFWRFGLGFRMYLYWFGILWRGSEGDIPYV